MADLSYRLASNLSAAISQIMTRPHHWSYSTFYPYDTNIIRLLDQELWKAVIQRSNCGFRWKLADKICTYKLTIIYELRFYYAIMALWGVFN